MAKRASEGVAASEAIPAIDIQALTADVPRGSWVAISSNYDRCVAFGKSVEDVIRKSAAKGEPEPLVVRVPEAEAALFL